MLKYFWGCGDNQIIEFAISRARLNRKEMDVIKLLLDDCQTQEKTAEILDISTRCVQMYWKSAADKLLTIPWVSSYAEKIKKEKTEK